MGIDEDLYGGNDTGKPIIDGNNKGKVIHISANRIMIAGFIIQNSSKFSSGIYLYTANNNNISKNIIINNNRGIFLTGGSSNNTVSCNTIFNASTGIELEAGSENNKFSGNSISNNLRGIDIVHSSNNMVSGNTISRISLYESSTTIITNNVFHPNGINFQRGKLNHWNTHTIENNTANGKPIRYYKNTNDVVVPWNTAQVILANCTNFTIQKLNMSGVGTGIQLGFSSDNNIIDNIITNNTKGQSGTHSESNSQNGIYLFSSSNNTIGNNKLNNVYDGICLRNSSNNSVYENTLTNNQAGIYLWYSSNSNLINVNKISKGNWCGIGISCSSNNNISRNTITNHTNWGILIEGSTLPSAGSNNKIVGNIIKGNKKGVEIVASRLNIVKENNFIENGMHAQFSYHILCKFPILNSWYGNYWCNCLKSIPKIIVGEFVFISFTIPWVNFDWHPAQKPYDIP